MIVAGFGFRRAASADSLRDALAQTGHRPDALATLADKADGLAPLASAMALQVIAVSDAAAQSQKPETTSQASQLAKGLDSVAEATALAAAGPGAQLICRRRISTDRMATCAIAKGTDT